MASAKEHWDLLSPQGLAGSGYEAWERRVHDAADVLDLLGLPLGEETIQEKLRLWHGEFPATEERVWVPPSRNVGQPIFCRVTHAAGVAVRSEPSLDARILSLRQHGEVVAVLAESSKPAWVQVLEPDGPGFMLGDGRLVGISQPLLAWLSPETGEAEAALQRHLGRQIHQVEALVLQRVRDASPLTCWSGRLPPVTGPSMPRVLALNATAGLIAERDSAGSSWRVLTTRTLHLGDLVEVCHIVPLRGTPGIALAPHTLELGEVFGMPLGYGSLYRSRREELPANCRASVVQTDKGNDIMKGQALFIHAACDVAPGEELQLGGGPLELLPPPTTPWTSEASPADYGEATSGSLRWGRSPTHGQGVFATSELSRQVVVELCPALVLDEQSRLAMADYSMCFHPARTGEDALAVLPLGFGAVYNHTWGADLAEYWYDGGLQVVAFVSIVDIMQGQEVLIDYGCSYWKNREQPAKFTEFKETVL